MKKITITVDEGVALRKESVDRNTPAPSRRKTTDMSLSARRAWIEMQISVTTVVGVLVALRKESVDRNTLFLLCRLAAGSSLSARRAWIEIVNYQARQGNF